MTNNHPMKTCYILHEYGARRHYLPHEFLAGKSEYSFEYLPTLSTPRAAIRDFVLGNFQGAKKNLLSAVALGKLIRMQDEIIIVGVAPFNHWVWFLAVLKKRNRIILSTSWPRWTFGNTVHHPRNRVLARAWWQFLNGLEVVAVTSDAARAVEQYGARATTIPHAYDPERFFPGTLHNDGRLQALFVGRMVAEKGILEILDAAISRPNIDWKFAGEGPLSVAVDVAAKKHAHIQNLGFLKGDNLSRAYQKTHVLIQPSIRTPGWEELFGIAIIEAMACGATCIASDNVGPASIIVDGQTGLLISSVTSQTVGQAIDILDLDRSKLKTLRLSACLHAEQEYELGHVAEQWLRVIHG